MTKIKYNKETKILGIRLSNKQSVDSDIRGNVVVDYDKEGKIVNLDIMSISLEEFSKTEDYFNRFLDRPKRKVANSGVRVYSR
ncbi:DUF2283 domain-containing protein [Patescibacteria group bacterium]|nr:DUF2283 domain-containing protein [Patescibacteria group bacterium]